MFHFMSGCWPNGACHLYEAVFGGGKQLSVAKERRRFGIPSGWCALHNRPTIPEWKFLSRWSGVFIFHRIDWEYQNCLRAISRRINSSYPETFQNAFYVLYYRSSIMKCINCVRNGKDDVNHPSYSLKCPYNNT